MEYPVAIAAGCLFWLLSLRAAYAHGRYVRRLAAPRHAKCLCGHDVVHHHQGGKGPCSVETKLGVALCACKHFVGDPTSQELEAP